MNNIKELKKLNKFVNYLNKKIKCNKQKQNIEIVKEEEIIKEEEQQKNFGICHIQVGKFVVEF